MAVNRRNGHFVDYNIFLIGFMGCGKTTAAEFLSSSFGMETLEMDDLISEREGMSISDIFARHGEEYFRSLETNLLMELQTKKNMVISCGGGTPLREINVAEMRKSGRIVLLTAHPETVYERIKDSHDRPLLENNKNIPFISELMEKRREKYEAASDVTVETDGKTASQICMEIIEKLENLNTERRKRTWQKGSQAIRN